MYANETKPVRRQCSGGNSGWVAFQQLVDVLRRHLAEPHIHQRTCHPAHLVWKKGVPNHLDTDDIAAFSYFDRVHFSHCARVRPFEPPCKLREVVYTFEQLCGLYHSVDCQTSPQMVRRSPPEGRPRSTAVDSIEVCPRDCASARIEIVCDRAGRLYRYIVWQVTVERADDDIRRVGGIRIEGDDLSQCVDTGVCTSGRLDSDCFPREARYGCFDLLLY